MKNFGVRWSEFDRKDYLVIKEKFFSTEKSLMNFVEKLQQKGNFVEIFGYTF